MEFIIVVVEVEVVVVIDAKLMVEVEVAGFMVDFIMAIADFKADFVEYDAKFNVHCVRVVAAATIDFDFAEMIVDAEFTMITFYVDFAAIWTTFI